PGALCVDHWSAGARREAGRKGNQRLGRRDRFALARYRTSRQETESPWPGSRKRLARNCRRTQRTFVTPNPACSVLTARLAAFGEEHVWLVSSADAQRGAFLSAL